MALLKWWNHLNSNLFPVGGFRVLGIYMVYTVYMLRVVTPLVIRCRVLGRFFLAPMVGEWFTATKAQLQLFLCAKGGVLGEGQTQLLAIPLGLKVP